MLTATITSKGQITIPKDIRDSMGLKSGDRIKFMQSEKGQTTFLPISESIEDLRGIVPKPKNSVTIEDMNETIRRRGAEFDRS